MQTRSNRFRVGSDMSQQPEPVFVTIDSYQFKMTVFEAAELRHLLTSVCDRYIHPERFDPPIPDDALPTEEWLQRPANEEGM